MRGKIADVGCDINKTARITSKPIQEFSCYPNPFAESFTLEIPSHYTNVKAELLNVHGITLDSKILSSGLYVWTPRTALPKGLYIIRVVADHQTVTLRIIKQ